MNRLGWSMGLFLFFINLTFAGPPDANLLRFLETAREKISAGNIDALRSLGEKADTIPWHIWLRGKDRLTNWKADLFPAPRGYAKAGDWWMIFHKFQLVEELCDRVHPVLSGSGDPQLGSEIPENISVPFRIESHDLDVKLNPAEHAGSFTDTFKVKRIAPDDKALWMRLNTNYKVTSAQVNGKTIPLLRYEGNSFPDPPDVDYWLCQAGGVLWLDSRKVLPDEMDLRIEYEGTVWQLPNDRIGTQYALLCSYWYPHIGRLPAKTRTRIQVPPDWIAIGQGEMIKEEKTSEFYRSSWQNDLPVCFFSIVAGPYQVTAEARSKRNNRLIRMYQLQPELDRAKQSVEKTARAMDFFEERFGDFPYTHYDLVDTPQFEFSGLEAYSFTFLDPAITLWACTHELGHSYWGGIVPNTYIRSIWNESMTQYSDSILFLENEDGTLQQGFTSAFSRTVPIGSANVPRDPAMAMAGYFRGSYVLRMLERELGTQMMIKTMRTFAEKRRGQASEWEDFERIVNETTRKDYSWFFSQWIYSAEVPELQILSAGQRASSKGGFLIEMRLKQSGTPKPYRLRFQVELTGGGKTEKVETAFSDLEGIVRMESNFKVESIRILSDNGYTIIRRPAVYRLSVSTLKDKRGPTAIVYGTGSASLKAAAGSMAQWLQELGYEELGVFSDREVQEEVLEHYNIVLVGNAEVNRVAANWKQALMGTQAKEGVVFSLQTHPKDRNMFTMWLNTANKSVAWNRVIETLRKLPQTVTIANLDSQGAVRTRQAVGTDPFVFRF
jgi:hypothetical protein